MAQLSGSARKYEQRVPKDAVDNQFVNPFQPHNNTVLAKSILDDVLGTTIYDLQTNEAPQNRIYVFADGTIGGTWTIGTPPTSYADRGTGYNYFDGTTWGTAPSTRIETTRTGWPSYGPWNGRGEFVIAHNSTTSLVMNTRTTKGTGTWTQTNAPTSPTGAPGIAWPRAITNGANHQDIHVLALTLPTASGGTKYKGLDGALLYWRSTDGGSTWDINGVQLPGMDSLNYASFGGDEYAWGEPRGDTIYFAAGGPYSDLYVMESVNNGTTWTKIPILSNANKNIKTIPAYMPPWFSSDGSVACQMDKNHVIHVLSGVGGGEIGNSTLNTEYILVNENGLIYWNTTMPMLMDSLNLDTLQKYGQLMGYYANGPNPGDTLLGLPQSYRVALTSHPQISIDSASGDIIVIWDGITYQNPDPSSSYGNYRHIWGRGWSHVSQQWTTNQQDFNTNIIYIFSEFVFPSMAKRIYNDKFDYIYQSSSDPGSAILTTTLSTETRTIGHIQQPLEILTGISPIAQAKNVFVGQNFPNPVTGSTSFIVNVDKPSNVTIDIVNLVGQKMLSQNEGVVAPGTQKFSVDCASLNSGIYFYTIKLGNQSVTKKMIIE